MAKKFPNNKQFLTQLRKVENDCEEYSIKKLNILGKKAILTYNNLGTVQSYLYRFACCYWGCKNDGHKLEYIIGRVVSHCQASLRVLGFGYYDESLALTRNISEIANLIALFEQHPSSFAEWKSLDEHTAWKKYSPGKVRDKIKSINGFIPIEKEHYGRLCSIGTHLNPLTMPQNYNPVNIPTVGAFFQELGFFVALNELSLSISIIGGLICQIGNIEKSIKKELLDSSIKLAEQSGTLTTDNMNTVWEKIKKDR
jgi:hypothetical protein